MPLSQQTHLMNALRLPQVCKPDAQIASSHALVPTHENVPPPLPTTKPSKPAENTRIQTLPTPSNTHSEPPSGITRTISEGDLDKSAKETRQENPFGVCDFDLEPWDSQPETPPSETDEKETEKVRKYSLFQYMFFAKKTKTKKNS